MAGEGSDAGRDRSEYFEEGDAAGAESSLADESEAVFSVLGDETRLAILLELATRSDPEQAAQTVPFSELRRAVGVDDAGRFNYHLDTLQDTFVVKDDDGYRATVAGLEVASAIHAGRFAADSADLSAETAYECPVCSDPLTAAYEDEVVTLECPEEDVWFSFPAPGGAAAGRSITELLDATLRRSSANIELARNGQCPRCWGRTTITPAEDDETFSAIDEEWLRVDIECERCWLAYYVSAPLLVAPSPPVVAFYEDHGLEPVDAFVGDHSVVSDSTSTVSSSDPMRIEVTIELDDDRLELVVDGDGEILETERS